MKTIRVTCPACKATLEVDADQVGTEVECSECFQVFKAKGGKSKDTPSSRGKPASTRPRRRREDDDYEHDREIEEYDEDDYDPDESRSRRRRASGIPSAAGTFGFGLLAFLTTCFPPLSILLAIVTMRRPAAASYPPSQAGLARMGKLLAQISLGFWLIAVVILYYAFRSN